MALLGLLTTPEAYRNVQDEVDAFYSENTTSKDSVISYADAKMLPYIQAVLREAMRLWPPTSGLFSKQVPDEGDTVHGYFLPGGTEIGQSMIGIGRQARIWGPDAEIFRPERWLEADPTTLEEMQAANDLVFSAGKYVCLGKQIAWMEMLKWFVEVSDMCDSIRRHLVPADNLKVLRRYDIAAVNNAQPLKLRDMATFMSTDFWIRFTKRSGVEL